MPKKYIPVDTLREFMFEAFVKSGVPEKDAGITADVLIASDLRGIESHGVGRLKMYLDRLKEKVQLPQTKFEIVKEAPATALVDGNHGMGQVIAYRSMRLAIEKAKKYGVAAVAVKNGSHFGIAGYYPMMAIKEDMCGITVTNARPSVAPTFGKKPMFGTNPIAFGVPTDEECPFLLDMGTPIVQRGKIEVYNREGKEIPPGWAIDMQGNYVEDPEKLLDMMVNKTASLLPLGGAGETTSGYKGYGLAMMVEILCSAFSGGPNLLNLSGVVDGKNVPHRLGYFMIAIDISKFIDVDEFKKITGDMMRDLRNCEKLPGQERIYTAGEKESDKESEIPKTGVPINDNLQEAMKSLKEEYGIDTALPF